MAMRIDKVKWITAQNYGQPNGIHSHHLGLDIVWQNVP